MYSELIFACGCVAKGKSTTAKCKQHGKNVVASTSGKRKRQVHNDEHHDLIVELYPVKGSAIELFLQNFEKGEKAFKYRHIVVPDDFTPLNKKTMIRVRDLEPSHIIGGNLAVYDLRSLRLLRLLLKAKGLYIRTQSPFIMRAASNPSIITTMMPCGSGKSNAKKKKAA